MDFRHFKTRAQAKAFIATQYAMPELTVRKKHGKHEKPFTVGTALAHLHFTKDAWVKPRKSRVAAQ